jgi:hypothetical protein
MVLFDEAKPRQLRGDARAARALACSAASILINAMFALAGRVIPDALDPMHAWFAVAGKPLAAGDHC